MNRRSLHFPAFLVGCFLYGALVVPHSNAATPKPKHGIGTAALWTRLKSTKINKLAPPVICNMENRLTIFVDEDQILWACECEVLHKGFICRWQVIGGVDPVNAKKRVKRYALPAVTA